MAENTNEQFEVPTAAELVDQLRTEETEPAGWSVYENEVFAQVFEFTEHRRLQVWDEADFIGSIEGYSWQEQLWSGSEWVDVTEISTEDGTPPLSVLELRERLATFRREAEETRPDSLTPREAVFDRMARSALGSSAKLARKVDQLEREIGQTAEELRTSETQNEKVRAALVALAQRITAPVDRRRAAPEDTGPVTGTSSPSTSGPNL